MKTYEKKGREQTEEENNNPSSQPERVNCSGMHQNPVSQQTFPWIYLSIHNLTHRLSSCTVSSGQSLLRSIADSKAHQVHEQVANMKGVVTSPSSQLIMCNEDSTLYTWKKPRRWDTWAIHLTDEVYSKV